MEVQWLALDPGDIEWMSVQSNSGSALVISGFLSVIEPGNLNQSLAIDPDGDVVSITASCYGFIISAGVRFGNVPDPWMFAPTIYQSIARPYHKYDYYTLSLDDSPSLYYNNDTAGMCCTMYGIVYDKNGLPVPNQWLELDNSFITGPSGEYSTRIFSRIYTWNSIYRNNWSQVAIEPISYALRPDSVIYRDIHLIDTLYAGVTLIRNQTVHVMKIYPNPATDLLRISLNIDLADPVFEYILYLCDITGKTIRWIKLGSGIGIITIPVDFSSGTYIARLEGDGRMIETSRFVIR